MINKKIFILTTLIALASCEDLDTKESEWKDAPEQYACNHEQLRLVENEFGVCNKSSFLSSYCYAAGLIKYCKRITEVKND